MHQIAIIIPAYKPDFLPMTLESLCNQTNKNFNVYIGDDNSPYDLKPIIDKYKSKLNLSYKKFDENLGGKDLVAQWHRCIALSKEEDWIWLFSDDDIMSEKCIETALKYINSSDNNLFRFNVQKIDGKGNKLKDIKFPQYISPKNLLKNEIIGKLQCTVIEYVFSRKIFNTMNGFVDFDLGWCSDIATLIKFSDNKKIKTIAGPKVLWRCSGENISTQTSPEITKRKIKALINYLHWGEYLYQDRIIKIYTSIGFMKRMLAFGINKQDVKKYSQSLTNNRFRLYILGFLYYLGKYSKILLRKS